MRDTGAVLRLHPVLGLLDDGALDRLARLATWRDFDDGEVVLAFGDATATCAVVASGRVQVRLRATRGAELVLRVIGPGMDVGAMAVVDGGAQPTEYVAEGPVRVVALAGTAVRAELLERPDLLLVMASRFADQVRMFAAGISDIAFLDVRRRLAKLVLAEPSDAAGMVELAATQSAAAARLGVTRQTLNRALAELVRRGWVVVDGARLRVVDRPSLERYADS